MQPSSWWRPLGGTLSNNALLNGTDPPQKIIDIACQVVGVGYAFVIGVVIDAAKGVRISTDIGGGVVGGGGHLVYIGVQSYCRARGEGAATAAPVGMPLVTEHDPPPA